ncbi:MAG TPA: Sir2 family NAD-dependent protein deacetylase [Xanthobacteraceae bacterium]|jgi:NAD-dependent deacetylase|nr:Sir2 family NAD-dependent protein deacetylase [Xanthobacteraceae bacterium]
MKAASRAAAIERLGELIAGSHRAVAFTGAGISTESGIPDFRSPGGLWDNNKPIPFGEFVASREMRNEAWRRKFAMEDRFRAAQPTRGHRALAGWMGSGKLSAIITQNIDNLHQASGVPPERIIELHGNGSYATCLDCATRYEIDWVRERFDAAQGVAPDCAGCGGPVKSATVSFGQAMPERAMQQAEEVTLSADLFIAIGSSLVVWPAAGFPLMAKQNGAKLVILNRERTGFDARADLVVHDDIGDILEPFLVP